MRNIIITSLLALTLGSVGCSKKSTSCDALVQHTADIVPEMKEQIEKDKDKAIAKCEKMSDEAKQCAADANNMEELMKCPHK
jgi:hypothetical protein